MFIQTQKTPNPNSLKFLPGKKVSNDGPHEFLKKEQTTNNLIRNIGVLYAIPDGVSLTLVRKMQTTTKIHHIIVCIFNVFMFSCL